MKFISLFSGVGGLDLGLEQAGHECVAQVEADEYCRAVLSRHFPHVPKFVDVRDVGGHNLPHADLIVGGFPCQDISSAGRRAGINEKTRSGLWFEFHRIVCEVRPRFVLVENVEALRHAGRGLDIVLADLAQSGFDAQWDVLSAASFGAAHLRERIFILAWDTTSTDAGCQRWRDALQSPLFAQCNRTQLEAWQAAHGLGGVEVAGITYPQLPAHLRAFDGLSDRLDAPDLKPKERRALVRDIPFAAARMKGCGNAVAVPVAAHVGKCLATLH